MLGKVAMCLKEGVPVNWQDVISHFMMDLATKFLFSKDIHSLNASTPYPSSSPLSSSSSSSSSGTRTDGDDGVYLVDWFMWSF